MHTVKITANLLFEYQCTNGKFISLANRIESKLFLPELKCSNRRLQCSTHDGILNCTKDSSSVGARCLLGPDATNTTQQGGHDAAAT